MRVAVAGATGLIGSRVATLAQELGHEVIGISREGGFDLTQPGSRELVEALRGVDVVVDVTQGPVGPGAIEFFQAVAQNLGEAATEVAVRRTVLLSIVGADRSPDYDYYVAKVEQEKVARTYAPGVVVLRATQFHDFAAQMLQWNREGDVTRIIDVPTQPVDVAEIVRLLVELATANEAKDTDLAGPQPEQLVDLVRRYALHLGDDVTVEAIDGPPSMAGGSMLPPDSAIIRGDDWQTWLERQG
ncbi:SDR family oxidoreductase [Demetria terragena]|uniref:SDR family oxidoreductase n=1 Tax=Demetria terragena TaxID=63959 RepID=UPI00035D3B85|nr:NAD-dependent epimerase/dehydratase family protein [Demetria terragena]